MWFGGGGGTGKHRLKVRIFSHGNRDTMGNYIRKDSSTALFNVVRINLALNTFSMRIGDVDVSGAYMQSGTIKSEIFLRPPRELEVTNRAYIWKLTKFPYGVTKAGR